MYLIKKRKKFLTNLLINKICELKNSYWHFGLKSNKNWFKKNVYKNDIHLLMFKDKNKTILVGYTLLRKRKYFANNRFGYYFYLDTIIIDKAFRGKKIGQLMMKQNNITIKKNKIPAFLICNKRLINFYKLNKWKIIKKNYFKLSDHKIKNKYGMVFNFKKIKKGLKFYIKKSYG